MSDENRISVTSFRGRVPAPRNLRPAPALHGHGLTKRGSGVAVIAPEYR